MPSTRAASSSLLILGLLVLGAPLLPAQAPVAPAPVRSHLRDRLQVSISGTVLRYATDLRVDAGDGTPGTDLDLEDDLGMPATVVRSHFGLRWRLSRRHEVEFGYLLARRSGERVLQDTVVVGDTSFAAGLRMQSTVGSDNASLTYRYAFHVRDKHEVGATLGLGALMYRSEIQAVAGSTSGGADTTIVPYAASSNTTVPTAAAGVYGRWQASGSLFFEADARALWFTVERITVNVLDVGVAARYFVNTWLGLEAGYAFNGVGAELAPRPGSAGNSLAGRFRYGLHSLRLGIVATK